VDRTHGSLSAQAEDLLRLLAAALSASRLYPLASPIRAEAIARFTRQAASVTAGHGPLQYYVDRRRFIIVNTAIGEAYPQVSALAETLHALQVGQLIVAPGVTDAEVSAFLTVLGDDPLAVRSSGGVRSAVLNLGVANIALIEVSLRASSEEGLLGLDITTAPLEHVAAELQVAVDNWSAQAEGSREDVVAEAINRLEPAARDLAMRRCAEALLLLDEATRLKMLSAAIPAAGSNEAMEGMLAVVGRMPPAALARLLQITAGAMGTEASELLGGLELPPEIAAELSALLRPSPQTEAQRGVPPEANVNGIAADVAAADEDDMAHIELLVRASTGRAAAARGLMTTIRMAHDKPTADSVAALADALKPAAREGALSELAAAASLLREISADPALSGATQLAQTTLHDPGLLETCARVLADDPGAEAARTLLSSAGSAGADALVSAYLGASELQRANLLPTVSAMIESIAPVAGRVLRSGDAAAATAVLRLLGSAGSRRLAATIASGLEHLDVRVREAAVVALADSPGTESAQLLQRALGHWDPETRRIAAREIGRTGDEELVPALLKIVGEVNLFERNYELKKEVLKSLEALHSPRAVPVLKRIADRKLVIGKKNRELRYLARRVLETLR
jgi:hypothetical protein